MITSVRDFFNTKCLGRVKGLDDIYISYESISLYNHVNETSATLIMKFIENLEEEVISDAKIEELISSLMSLKVERKIPRSSKLESTYLSSDLAFFQIISGRIYSLHRFFKSHQSSKYLRLQYILAITILFLKKCLNDPQKAFYQNYLVTLSFLFVSENADAITKTIFLMEDSLKFKFSSIEKATEFKTIVKASQANAISLLKNLLGTKKVENFVIETSKRSGGAITSGIYSNLVSSFLPKIESASMEFFNGESVDIYSSSDFTLFINTEGFLKDENSKGISFKFLGFFGRMFIDWALLRSPLNQAFRIERSINSTRNLSIGYEWEMMLFSCLDYQYWKMAQDFFSKTEIDYEEVLLDRNVADQGILRYPRTLILPSLPFIMFSS